MIFFKLRVQAQNTAILRGYRAQGYNLLPSPFPSNLRRFRGVLSDFESCTKLVHAAVAAFNLSVTPQTVAERSGTCKSDSIELTLTGIYFSTVTVKYFLTTVLLLSFTFVQILYTPAFVNLTDTVELELKSCFFVHVELFISL